ncbi:MAG: hypothetical protein AB7V14_02760 [Kiritimatiellia bacterium]
MSGNCERQASRSSSGRFPWRALLLLNAGVFLWAHAPALRNPLCCADDARQQIFWMQQWRDAALYPDDLLIDYARHYVPWGVKGLYGLAACIVDPMVFSKWLPGILFVGLGALLFAMGRRLAGSGAGWGIVGAYWLMPFFLEQLAGGLARSFAAPLLALFVWGWLARRAVVVGWALVLQALFIPYLAPVCAGAALALRLLPRSWRGDAWVWPAGWGQAAGLGVALALAFGWQATLAGSDFGPLVGPNELTDSVFSRAGRYGFGVWPPASLFHELIVVPWGRIAPFQEWGTGAGIAVVVVLVAALAWAARRVEWRSLAPALPLALAVAAASIGAFLFAQLFPLRFFIPNRYVIYPVNLAYVLLLGLAAHAAWRAWAPRRRAIGAALLLSAALLGAWRLHGVGLYDFSPDAPAIEAARALPSDALVAGPPALMDNVLAFGQRRVLASFELAHPWLRGYWARIEPRLRDLFAAYYAADPAEIRAFCARHGVDWMMVDERDFPEGAGGKPETAAHPRAPDFLRGRPFFAPFDGQIQALVAGRTHFAILSQADFPYVRLDPNRRLLDMRPSDGSNGK